VGLIELVTLWVGLIELVTLWVGLIELVTLWVGLLLFNNGNETDDSVAKDAFTPTGNRAKDQCYSYPHSFIPCSE